MSILEAELQRIQSDIKSLKSELALDPIEQELLASFGAQLLSATAHVESATSKRPPRPVNKEIPNLEKQLAEAVQATAFTEAKFLSSLRLQQFRAEQREAEQ